MVGEGRVAAFRVETPLKGPSHHGRSGGDGSDIFGDAYLLANMSRVLVFGLAWAPPCRCLCRSPFGSGACVLSWGVSCVEGCQRVLMGKLPVGVKGLGCAYASIQGSA